MSGWIWISVDDRAEHRMASFRKTFDVSGVAPLNLKVFNNGPGVASAWMWKVAPDWADIAHAADGSGALLLDGYLTDAGRFGDVPRHGANTAAWLLGLWRAHGEALLPELNGSFSLTVLSVDGRDAIVATDRWCSRPVWYAVEGETLLLANNTSSVAALYEGSLHLDKAGVWSLLAGNRPVAERTIYREIQRIGAGQLVKLRDGVITTTRRWYELKFEANKRYKAAEWGEQIAAALRDSASAISKLGDPNLFLSGGLDSRIAAGAFSEVFDTTTIISGTNLSSEVAERVANAVGSRHQTLYRDDNWYLNAFGAASLAAGGNYNVHHAHFFQAVERLEVLPGTHFVLGDLAENFNEHYWKISDADAQSTLPADVVPLYPKLDKYSHKNPHQLSQLFADGMADDCSQQWGEAFQPVVDKCFTVSEDARDSLDALFRWHDNCFCPTNLMLECVRPVGGHANLMFDNRLFELMQQVPADMKTKGVLHKATLKHLNFRLLWIPNSNFWLPPVFPAWMESANRDWRRKLRPLIGKIRNTNVPQLGAAKSSTGSWHVMYQWYWNDPAHRDFLHDLIDDEQALPRELFDRQGLRNSLAAFEAGDVMRRYEIYPLISFALIHRQLPTTGF